MLKRISSVWIAPAVLGAALAAYLIADHRSAPAVAPALPVAATAPSSAALANVGNASLASSGGSLPPNHPAVPGFGEHGAHGMGALPNGDNQEPPSIDWKAPADWKSLPNPNAMRLATYRVGEGAELSVARAGGPVDANILRWSQQFDGAPQAERREELVHGLHVTIVRIAGTYQGGGMSMGTSAPEKHEGWVMRAAIVEAQGAPYFFKLVGPATQVDRAAGSFDSLVASVAPRAGG